MYERLKAAARPGCRTKRAPYTHMRAEECATMAATTEKVGAMSTPVSNWTGIAEARADEDLAEGAREMLGAAPRSPGGPGAPSNRIHRGRQSGSFPPRDSASARPQTASSDAPQPGKWRLRQVLFTEERTQGLADAPAVRARQVDPEDRLIDFRRAASVARCQAAVELLVGHIFSSNPAPRNSTTWGQPG